MGKKTKAVIGLLVSGITDSFTVSVCRGAMKEAEDAGITLVILPGKYLDRDLSERKEIMYEYQYNTLFSFARTDNLDAVLILADSIGCYASSAKIRELVDSYRGVPCVLIASKLEGYCSVNYDNKSGIQEAMRYLINSLKLTKFGMIGGPNDNTDAYERKQAFFEALSEYGIPYSEKNYVSGCLSRFSQKAFQEMLDNFPEVEAVFCVNDDTAIGFYETLKKRGIVPGKDVMVFGYDNTVLAAKLKPALSSVWTDHAKLGKIGLSMVLRMLEGETVQSEVLPARFIRRDSFGGINDVDGEALNLFDKEHINALFDKIFYRYESEEFYEDIKSIRQIFRQLMESVITSYELGESSTAQRNEILRLLDVFLGYQALEYADVGRFLTYVEQMHNWFSKEKEGFYKESSTSFFFMVYRKIVMSLEQRFVRMCEEEERKQYTMKLFVKDSMQFEKGTDQSYAVLLENLSWLDIQNAAIYVFTKPIMHLEKEKIILPDKMLLKAVLRGGKTETILATRQKRSISELFCPAELEGEQTVRTQVLLPLFSNEMLYGVILCDMTEKVFENGEFLTYQFGSAIKVIELLKANAVIQSQLEESLITLKENNIALDTLSKSDALTGILNRRGFMDAAKEILQRNQRAGKRTLVAYIDMNNLKIVNDRYGHDEGDFSIKVISEQLIQATKGGIAGRVGGDEFAIIMEYPIERGERVFIEEIYKGFQQYNQTSTKPYNITVSAGTCLISAKAEIGLKEALNLADGKLYEEKQHKEKTVAKG